MWTVLKDTENNSMMAYSHVTSPLPEDDRTKDSTTGNKRFSALDLSWVAPTEEGHQQPKLIYNRAESMKQEEDQDFVYADKHMHIMHTNYASYLVGKTCQNILSENGP